MYLGPVNTCVPYFEKATGIMMSLGENPADFMIDCVSFKRQSASSLDAIEGDEEGKSSPPADIEKGMGDLESGKKQETLDSAVTPDSMSDTIDSMRTSFEESQTFELMKKEIEKSSRGKEVGNDDEQTKGGIMDEFIFVTSIVYAFWVITRRFFTAHARDMNFLMTRVIRCVSMACVLASIFYGLGHNQSGLNNRISFLFFCSVFFGMSLVVYIPSSACQRLSLSLLFPSLYTSYTLTPFPLFFPLGMC
jgi:hypothetical protein